MPPTLLFSDVDGTLLDREGRYAMRPAELAQVRDRVTVILASSRTILELSRNQRDLGLDGPVVAENGAVIALPWDEATGDLGAHEVIDDREWCVVAVGAPAQELRAEARAAAESLGTAFVDQHVAEPGVGRRYSLALRPAPGQAADSLDRLANTLRRGGRAVASGGTWLCVTGGADKGRGVRTVLDCLRRLGRPIGRVAAAGDGDNDVPLLLAAERRFVIGHDDGTWHPALRVLPRAECVPIPGVAGWREVIRQLAEPQEV
ncbi:MAG: hypothetical protein AMXMBFR55_02800 [Gemmatimonadota bacterium]